jgi:transposase
MSQKKFCIQLSHDEVQQLQQFIMTGIHAARAIIRARILLLAHSGHSDPAIAEEVGVCLATVFNIRRRYCQEGLQAVLTERARPGQPRKLDGPGEAHLTAIACSAAPDGRVRWTAQLLADRLVDLALVDAISARTISRVLKKTI